ncbi:MAG: nucleotide exchange factor GrpE [Patescibacteria group bacterium]
MLEDSLVKNNNDDSINIQSDEKSTPEVDYKKQADEYLALCQRARADYQNLKKDTEKKIAEYLVSANSEILHELLPLVDYFKHAFRHIPTELKGSDWVEGIRHIQSKLEQVLAYFGVKEMEVIGEKFNPELHEAAGEVVNTGQEHGVIVEELRSGFILHDKVLQAARVKIAK